MNLKKYFSIPLLVSAVLGGIIGGTIIVLLPLLLRESVFEFIYPNKTQTEQQGIKTPPPVLQQDGGIAEDEQTVAVVERVRSSVVAIAVTKDLSKMTPYMDPFFGEPVYPFEDQFPQGKQKVGGGSGFLVSSDGLIITNKHVVDDEDAEYTVVLPSGKKFLAKVLARDPVLDLAVIDVEGEGYPFLTFGDSDKLEVGQTVIAIGNALDEFPNTVTKGIVSGLNRNLTAQDLGDSVLLEEAIQTDAAINMGNSGGPLIDLYGHVVGVNTAVSYSGQLLGFALPGNLAKRDVEQVEKLGRITRPFLGVRYLIIDEELIERNQLTIDHGVLISRGAEPGDLAVVPGSPADKAGIQENDVIIYVNDIPINQDHSLSSLVGRYLPGDKVRLTILRHGEELDLEVELGEFKVED